MKRPVIRKVILAVLVVLVFSAGYILTRGNAVWRIRSHYPDSELSLAGDRVRDISISGAIGSLIRGSGLDYYGGGEPVQIPVKDTEEPIDLEDFKGIKIEKLTFVNCTLRDVRFVMGNYRPWTTYTNCDLSAVPATQMKYLDFKDEIKSYNVNGRRLDEEPPDAFTRPHGICAFYP